MGGVLAHAMHVMLRLHYRILVLYVYNNTRLGIGGGVWTGESPEIRGRSPVQLSAPILRAEGAEHKFGPAKICVTRHGNAHPVRRSSCQDFVPGFR